jgi:TctA family transporter
MLESLNQALLNLTDPLLLGVLVIGCLSGLIVGIIPAIGGLVGCTLLLAFIHGVSPEVGLGLLLAFASVTYTGGSVTAILVSIPGTPVNAATLIDGFPMTQKGEAGRALGAALTSSGLGGILAGFMTLLTIPLVAPIVMNVTTSEMFLLILMGLSFLAVLGRGSMIKGLITGTLGILFALVGFQATTGNPRFTFGSLFLLEGLDIVPVILGLFALSELIDLYLKGAATISQGGQLQGFGQVWEGLKDVFRHFWLWLRSTIIGYLIGIIPGVGGETAIFVTYGIAKQSSRNRDKFGTGCVEGVIAPEAANNAKESGALLTTLVLGIPGAALMAVILAGLLLVGITPGPKMVAEHLDLTLTLILILIISNLLACVISLVAAPWLARVVYIPLAIILPLVLILIFTGAYVRGESLWNFPVLLIFGLLGLFMKRLDYSRPAFALGFVLGSLAELYMMHAISLHGRLFFLTPPCLVIIAIIIFLPLLPHLRTGLATVIGRRRGTFKEKRPEEIKMTKMNHNLSFPLSLLVLGIGFLIMSVNLPLAEDKVAPILFSGLLICLAIMEVGRNWRAKRDSEGAPGLAKKVRDGERSLQPGRILGITVWVAGPLLGFCLLGFHVTIPLFMFSYIKLHGRGWFMAIIMAVLTTAFFVGVCEYVLQIEFYEGLIFELLG